ncbi:hypothetical protein GQX73_g3167 [Xylaria multiplex]|uniref:DUF7729 domain-containing protein n=1 Tax=Xylaria multiplex TaxID=323545 RepID=A0A7C8IRH8_9PEZI|nr:hypothetical protein GQX73_g3167 [Xylaria multiplex]
MSSHRRSSDRGSPSVAATETVGGRVTDSGITGSTEMDATQLDRCWRWHDSWCWFWFWFWRGPLGSGGSGSGSGTSRRSATCLTGPASASRLNRAVIILLISCWICLSTAASISLDESPRPTLFLTGTNTGAEAEAEVQESRLLIDTRIPVFVDGHWQIMSDEEHRELRRREAAPKETTPQTTTMTTEVVIETSTVTDSANPATTTVATSSPLPSPFDGALAANFSGDNSCPTFINDFLSNATFKACYPISLLLQGSQSFFEAEKSFYSITLVLDAACKADVDMCTDYFNDLASSLIADGHCGKEYDRQNALVVQAYRGMKTYNTVYKATCLANQDSSSSEYCFAKAITNSTTPSNAYLYYLPFNSTLPSTAAPICGSCTEQTMAIYQAATSNRKADITNTYLSAAEQINSECGANFVNTSLAAVVESSSTSSYPASSSALLLLSFAFMAISHWIL